jgi:hypothetical protein
MTLTHIHDALQAQLSPTKIRELEKQLFSQVRFSRLCTFRNIFLFLVVLHKKHASQKSQPKKSKEHGFKMKHAPYRRLIPAFKIPATSGEQGLLARATRVAAPACK